MATDEPDRGGTSPCFADTLIGGHPVDPQTARDVARFRRSQRQRLLQDRKMATNERTSATMALIDELARIVSPAQGMRISVYWPIRGEPDLRAWMTRAHGAGAQILLPVVIEKNKPLAFQTWTPDCRMERGLWNIPVPADGKTEQPDIVIAPLLGADTALYRLGNGGGYYDRTLATLTPPPRVIGIGFAGCLLPSIFPMPWDIPMDEILLSDGTRLTG